MTGHENGQASEPSTTSHFVWHELLTSSSYVRRKGWEFRDLPRELTMLPDDVVIHEKLQRILDWSLVPGSNWSFEPPPKAQGRLKPRPQRCSLHELSGTSEPLSSGTSEVKPLICDADITPTSPNQVISSHLSVDNHGNSPDGERSLKNKLLSKIRPRKSDDRTLSTEAKSITKIVIASPATAECTSCFEDLPESDMTRLKSCRHWYCKECLSTLITTAMASEASFPPKCCLSSIPLKQILKALNAKQREDYQNKAAEYAVPTTDRWYCPNTDCLQWIPRSKLKINRTLGYDCPHCSAKLCRTCRGDAHPENTECPQDYGLEATLETAEVEGWQRCYKCRAMVEHNTGCRHMTCRCKAEFCYVCGLRWQTCSCTETDAANKRAGIQQRRDARTARDAADAVEDEEAAEIAQAIAEVEEMERREAEERRLEEERREREEAEQLLLLEAERQAEEARKKEEAEQAERDFQDALLRSFEEELRQLETILNRIHAYQSEAIMSRHEAEDARLGTMHHKDEAEAKEAYKANKHILSKNAKKRHSRLQNKHKTDVTALESRQEEDEDDLFLQVQMRLKGKANRESRMERMLAEIHKQQEEEKNELQDKHKEEVEQLEKNVAVDSKGLRRTYEHKIQEARDKQITALHKFGYIVGAERQYFEIVAERRSKMLALHGQNSLTSIRQGNDPVGLTEYEASRIQPRLPGMDDGEPGPSGIRRGPTTIMTTHGPLAINPRNHFEKTDGHDSIYKHVPWLQIDDSFDGHETLMQRRPSHPPIPGAFPTDSSLSIKQAPPHPQSQPPPPPPVPQTRSPPLPSSLTPPPLTIRKPVVPPPVPLSAASEPLRQHSVSTDATTLEAVSMASYAAGQALSTMFQPAAVPPALSIDTGSSKGRQSSTSSSMTVKKSKWGFMKPRDLTEDEMKRKLRAAVGDAF